MIQISRSLQKASTLMLVIFLSTLLSPGIEAVKAAAEETTTSSATSSTPGSTTPLPSASLPNPTDHLQTGIDAFTGALTYQYNFSSPPGRNNLEPQLSLNYNSLTDDDMSSVGYGWALNLPSVQRLPGRGSKYLFETNPGFARYSSSLSGELTETSEDGTYEAQIEKGDALQYEFSDDTWTAVDKSGVTYIFGSSTDSRQDDPSDSSKIFKWMLEEIRDPNGNFVRYSYSKLEGQIYPSEIVYTGNGTTDGDFTVSFELTPNPSPMTSYSSGFKVTSARLIETVRFKKTDVDMRTYTFNYTTGHNQNRPLLQNVSETVVDSEGVETVLPSTDFSYQTPDTGWALEDTWDMPLGDEADTDADGIPDEYEAYQFSDSSGDTTSQLIDVNADGLLDFVAMTAVGSTVTGDPAVDDEYRVYLNTGSGWEVAEDWTMPLGAYSAGKYATYNLASHIGHYNQFMDVNGDGLPDFIVMSEDVPAYTGKAVIVTGHPELDENYRVFLNTGSSWELAEDWIMPLGDSTFSGTSFGPTPYNVTDAGMSSSYYASYFNQFMDVNGDGLPDFVVMQANGLSVTGNPAEDDNYRVFMNNGSGWSVSTWPMPLGDSTTTWSGTTYASYSLADGYRQIFQNQFLDVNGDALPDFVVMDARADVTGDPSTDDHYRVYLNSGQSWDATNWKMPLGNSDGSAYNSYTLSKDYGYHYNAFEDVNGDGLVDFVVMHDPDNPSTVSGDPSTDENYRTFFNTGSGWELAEDWLMPLEARSTPGEFNAFGLTDARDTSSPSNLNQFVDVNGDKLPDFIVMSSGTTTTDTDGCDDYCLFLNTGNGWELNDSWAMPSSRSGSTIHSYFPYNRYDSPYHQYVDLNGDALVDFVTFETDPSLEDSTSSTVTGDPTNDFYYRAYLSTGTAADLLSSISLSTGASISVSYKETPIVDKNPYVSPQTMLVVSSITSDDGLGGTETKTYSYEDGKYYFHPIHAVYPYKSFTGFALITETSSSGKIKKTFYHQGNDSDAAREETADHISKIGLPYLTETYNDSGDLYQSEFTLWDYEDYGEGPSYQTQYFVYTAAQVTLTYDGLSSHRDRAVEYTYDEDGNVETVVNYGEVDADEDGSFTDVSSTDEKSTTTYSYAVDSSGVIRNKVSEQKITNDSGLTLQKTRYFYDSLSYGSVSTGNLTREAQWQSAGDTWMNTDYGYDAYGLVSSVKNPRGFTTSYTYDAAHLYPEVSTNPKGFTVTRSYDYATGKITSQTDENGYTSETTYDGLGRVLTISVPDPSTGTLTELSSTSYDDDSVPNSITTTTTISGVTSESVTYLDGFGRTVETNTLAEDGQYSTVDTWYDDQGNVAQQTLPYFSSSSTFGRDESAESTVTTYDVLNRPTLVTTPTGSTSYDYSLWATTVTDPNGNDKVYSYSAAGQLVQVEEENTSAVYSTVYHYNPLGQLVQLTDDQGSVRHFHYDTLGRKVSQEDLHAASETSFGTWTYVYDPNNNLVSQTDPKGQTITWAYDELDRPTYEDWDSSTTPHEILYFYDTAPHGKMKLAQVKSNFNDFVVTYTGYDALGNLSSEMHSTKKPGLSTYYDYSFQTSYDLLSRPTKVVYPGGALTVNTVYNATGQVEKVTRGPTGGTNVIADMDYNAAGQITSMAYANGVTTTNVYDAAESYRLGSKISTGVYSGTSGNIQDLTYAYDDNGNITGIVDASITPTNKTLTYTYDDLNRLLTASSSGFAVGDYSESYSYDSVGNLTSKSDVGSLTYSGTGASSGTYSGANPHAVTGVGTSTYTYDLNGNLTGDGTHTYSWDKRNHLSASGTLSYSYDNTGSRYKTVDTSSGIPSFNYYVSRYEELRGGTGTTPGTPTYYIFAGSQRVATFESGNFYYILEDHLGGTSLVTNSAGAVDQIYDYFPYGSEAMNTKLGTNDVRHSFTDKELEDTLGLYYFEARWYNPSIGRFIGEDPMQWEGSLLKTLGDPQRLNYYSYSGNNPVKNIDSTGKSWYNPFTWDWGSIGSNLLQTLDTAALSGDISDVYTAATGTRLFTQEKVSQDDINLAIIAQTLPIVTAMDLKIGGEMLEAASKNLSNNLPFSAASKNNWGNAQTLLDHFERHGDDFGITNPSEYASAAQDFYNKGLQGSADISIKVTDDGVTKMYDASTNTFGSYNADGSTKTYFKPTKGEGYWEKQ